MGEGRACSNLGIVYQLLGEHDAALKLHQAHLSIARQLQVHIYNIWMRMDGTMYHSLRDACVQQ